MTRWSTEQIEAIAPSAAAMSAARPAATMSKWRGTGADERAVWGSFHGTSAEPYDTMVDHVLVGFACTCPSRRVPCKHALGLLLMWSADHVAEAVTPARVHSWIARRPPVSPMVAEAPVRDAPSQPDASDPQTPSTPPDAAGSAADSAGSESADDALGDPDDTGGDPPPDPPIDPDRDRARDERVERMHAGLSELDRWLDDRIRTGLADPSLARYGTWDSLAARLVDAQAGSLANRIRRLAGLVGASPSWHEDVLAELGLLHLLAQAGRRLGSLPSPLADAVATSVGWQVRQADVLGGVPDTDHWVVAGRSDTREDRIEVRRHWLRGERSGRWALVLSFAAYRQSLDTSLAVGTSVHADLHRYPGPALRALVGTRHEAPTGGARPPASSIAGACDELGATLVAEPWLDRVPVTVRAALSSTESRWVLTDETGSLPLVGPAPTTSPAAGGRDGARVGAGGGRSGGHEGVIAMLLAVSGGQPVDVTVEWTPHGIVPLTVHLERRSIDIGPRADDSFVGAA